MNLILGAARAQGMIKLFHSLQIDRGQLARRHGSTALSQSLRAARPCLQRRIDKIGIVIGNALEDSRALAAPRHSGQILAAPHPTVETVDDGVDRRLIFARRGGAVINKKISGNLLWLACSGAKEN